MTIGPHTHTRHQRAVLGKAYRLDEHVDVRGRVDADAIEVELGRVRHLALDARPQTHLRIHDEVVHELEPGVMDDQVLVEFRCHLADLKFALLETKLTEKKQ